jgi:hypothetical protein
LSHTRTSNGYLPDGYAGDGYPLPSLSGSRSNIDSRGSSIDSTEKLNLGHELIGRGAGQKDGGSAGEEGEDGGSAA